MQYHEDIEEWAIWARVELEMGEDEFYALTPAKFEKYINQWKDKEKRIDRKFARIGAYIAWANGNQDVTEDQLMPVERKPVEEGEEVNNDDFLKARFCVAMGISLDSTNQNG